MKNKTQIPLSQICYFVVLFILIVLRIALDNLNQYVNLANYISMIVSFLSIWGNVINKSKSGRSKNICKTLFVFILISSVIFGFCILFFDIVLHPVINDVFTLIALLFCICNSIFESIFKKIFGLSYKND